jgi:hypothetical protein
MSLPEEQPLSAEDMARLIEGRGDPDQLAEWRLKLIKSPAQLKEYLTLSKLVNTPSGTVEPFEVKKWAEKLFPIAPPKPFEGIRIRLKSALEIHQDAGWASMIPAFRGPDPVGEVVLSKVQDGLKIDLRLQSTTLSGEAPSKSSATKKLDIIVSVTTVKGKAIPALKVELLGEGFFLSETLKDKPVIFRGITIGDYRLELGDKGSGLKISIPFRVE